KFIGLINVRGIGRRGKHDNHERVKLGALANPLEQVKPHKMGEFEIQQQQVGQRIALAVCVGTLPVKIVERLRAVLCFGDWVLHADGFQGHFQKQNVVGVILDNQNSLIE